MGTATVEVLTTQQVEQERSEILREMGMSLDEVRERAEEGLLTLDQTARWRRAEELTWLLGE